MAITSYQIHNILKDFVQQLQRRCQGEADGKHPEAPAIPSLTRESDRLKSVADNLAATILQRLADAPGGQPRGAARRPPRPILPEAPRMVDAPPAFEYMVLEPQGAKRACRLTVEDAQMLIERFLVLDNNRETPPSLPEAAADEEG
jgi:hypothetical protein